MRKKAGVAYDVAVIGGGPAGAATARQLALRGCHVLLIERSGFDVLRVGETLAPSVQPLLVELGVWDMFLALNPLPSWGTRSVWGRPEPQEHSHLISPYGCGWHVDRQSLDRMLAYAAVTAGATLSTGTWLVGCDRGQDKHWLLKFATRNHTSEATARIVVDATGRSARLGQRFGAQRVVFDKLIGIVAQFSPVRSDEQCYTLVETVADGWWYSAPVGDDRLMVMLMTDADLCALHKLTAMHNWLAGLNATTLTARRVSNKRTVLGPQAFSAASQRLQRDKAVLPWLAVGDAALAVDPISGSGVVRSFRTASVAAALVFELLEGAPLDTIRQYEAARDLECTQYLKERAMYYGAEHRWLEAPFWQRRVHFGPQPFEPTAQASNARRFK